jgi:hypothetical protein
LLCDDVASARQVRSRRVADPGWNGKLAHRCFPLRRIASRPGYWLEFLVALAVVAVAQRRLGPSSSVTTSTTDRALPSSAVQLRCWSRPTTTTRLPLAKDCAACSAWSRHTMTVKNDGSCSRWPETATRNLARAIPPSVARSSGCR